MQLKRLQSALSSTVICIHVATCRITAPITGNLVNATQELLHITGVSELQLETNNQLTQKVLYIFYYCLVYF